MSQPLAVLPPVNLALFGVGRWGTHLLRHFSAHPRVNLRAVVEASPERLATLKSDLDSSNSDHSIALTSDWQAAMALDGLDACVIATPAATHYELIEAALKKGLHVLAEKPLTLDVASSQRLCELAERQQKQLVIDHTYLFHGAVREGRKAIAHLGPLRYGYATRTHLGPVRRDVDALWDLAIHDISIFNYWLGESPVRVQCQGSSWLQLDVQTSLSPNGLADVMWCRLQYPSGFQATIHLCWANPDKQRRLCVVGDEATLIFDEMNWEQPLVEQRGRFAKQDGWFTPQQIETVPLKLANSEPLGDVCKHFIQCVEGGERSPISSGTIGTELVTVLVALSRSLEQAGQWTDCADK
ncbi:MAG: oxidoreductase [Leptolyngbya foveolarum]|uniref:Oxidoreductase n=1 Tax=Leptolyngbya foveolarum TaxID=47253 RepID=A0A2W4TJ63_9CYAN|nr:MAG: oxidoreductase [Leptolyngbya foveolarum]